VYFILKNHKTPRRSKLQVDELLSAYRNQRGIRYCSGQIGVDPSYESRVADGHGKSETIRRAIAAELSRVRRNATKKPDGEYLKVLSAVSLAESKITSFSRKIDEERSLPN
jgi:hypothetical protein